MLFLRERAEQRAIADHVDDARNAVAQPMHFAQRRAGENFAGRGARDLQPMIHIRGRFGARQRVEVIAAGDALGELAQLDARQHFAQLGLTDQDDLQQLLRRGLEVREQPHLLERFRRQVLRLIDDHHDAAALRVRFQQAPVEEVDEVLDARRVLVAHEDAELFADRQDELDGRQLRVEDDGDVGMARHALEQRAHHGGLAGADLAGQLDEAAGFVDPVQQMRERLGMPLAHEEIARVRGDGEGLLAQSEKARVHAGMQAKRGKDDARRGLGLQTRPLPARVKRAEPG